MSTVSGTGISISDHFFVGLSGLAIYHRHSFSESDWIHNHPSYLGNFLRRESPRVAGGFPLELLPGSALWNDLICSGFRCLSAAAFF
jgi:hypothetical protein